ncbi:MAG: tetratricopeptide repeat protein [Pseudomonadota bacterium]
MRHFLFAILFWVFPLLASAHAAGEMPGLVKATKAGLAFNKGQFQVAIELYTEALQDEQLTNDRKGVILTDRGVVHMRTGKTKQALEDFNQGIRLFPEYAAAYNNRGSLLLSIGLSDEALKDFNRAIVLGPGYIAAYNNRAAAFVKKRQFSIASEDYTQAVKLAPSQAPPLAGRARINLARGRPYAAMRDLNKALLNDPRFALGFRLRGQAHADLGDYEKAAEDLSRAIAFDPSVVGAYLARGRAYLETRKVEAAVNDFTKVIELRPQSATAYRERGHAYVLLDAFDLAEQDIARALEIEPRAGLSFAYRALMYKKQGQPELGAQEISKAMGLAPKNAKVLWAKGEIEEALAETQSAIESFGAALALDPTLKTAEYGLSRLGQPVPNQARVLEDLSFGPWRIILDRQKFYATHQDLSGLRVPLEMMSQGQPRIVEWEERGEPPRQVGLLRFSVGKTKGRSGEVDVEYVALINMSLNEVLDLVPDRRGKQKSNWTWTEAEVTVASIDGLTSKHIYGVLPRQESLTEAAPRTRSRARRRRVDDSGTPFWAPWANNAERARPRRKRRARRRRRKPKTLFDTLFGN